MFVRTIVPDVMYADRCWNLGSVIDVEENRAKGLIEDKAAVPADGPQSEPKRAAAKPTKTDAE